MASNMTSTLISRFKGETGLLELADATLIDMELNQQVVAAKQPLGTPPKTATWFIPMTDHVLKGGVRTIFSVAENLSVRWNTQNYFIVYSYSGKLIDISHLQSGMKAHFPGLLFEVLVFQRGITKVCDLPSSDIAFCTLWTTAYLLLRYNQTKRKYYFLQDYEPVFYPGGSVYAVIEATYRFGFTCIANTPGVAQRFRRYSNDVISFCPGINLDIFYSSPRQHLKQQKKKIVFYGRPGNDRNAFALGLSVLKDIKSILGDQVEIVSAGSEWSPVDYGVAGIVHNLGLLNSLEEVADLYRSSDIGLVFMFSAHPSYQPLEFMACGCVVATNINENNEWLLKNNQNCLLLNPVPRVAAECIFKLLEDPATMARYRMNGLDTVRKYSWNDAFATITRHLL